LLDLPKRLACHWLRTDRIGDVDLTVQ
jgi:hypothetical protein